MIHKMNYGNSVIYYNLIKSNRIKTSQITVTTNNIIIRTPKTKSDKDIQNMIKQRIQWINKKQLYFKSVQEPTFSTKSKLAILGKHYKISIFTNHPEHTRLVGNKIEFHISQKKYTMDQIKAQYEKYLEKRSNSLFLKLVDELSIETGIIPVKVNIKHLRDRWGSSTKTGQINLNINLIKASKHIIKYVILHELCHFKIKEHSHHFWNLLAHHMPDYKESYDWLDHNGIKIS